MEPVAICLDLDELSDKVLARNVAQHDVARVVLEDGKLVGNDIGLISLLHFESNLHVVDGGGRAHELRIVENLSDQSVARQNEALLDVGETLVLLALHDESVAHHICRTPVVLFYLKVLETIVEELPGEGELVLVSRRPEHEVSHRFSLQMLQSLGTVGVAELVVPDPSGSGRT